MAEILAEDGDEEEDDEEDDDSDGDEDDDDDEDKDEDNVGSIPRTKQKSSASNRMVKDERVSRRMVSSKKAATSEEEDEDEEDDDADPSKRAKAVTLARQQQEKIERQKQKQKLNGVRQANDTGVFRAPHPTSLYCTVTICSAVAGVGVMLFDTTCPWS